MKMNICVFPAQKECAVEINYALSNCESIEVYGVAPVKGHNAYNFNNYYSRIPSIEEAEFNDFFKSFFEEHEIGVVFPTSNPVLLYLAENKE